MDKFGRVVFSEEAEKVLNGVMLADIGAYDEIMVQLKELNDWTGRFLQEGNLIVDSIIFDSGFIILNINKGVDSDVVNMLDCKLLVFQGKNLICKNIVDLTQEI